MFSPLEKDGFANTPSAHDAITTSAQLRIRAESHRSRVQPELVACSVERIAATTAVHVVLK
jgi:hypothetical protein